jgi:hypothetical protein
MVEKPFPLGRRLSKGFSRLCWFSVNAGINSTKNELNRIPIAKVGARQYISPLTLSITRYTVFKRSHPIGFRLTVAVYLVYSFGISNADLPAVFPNIVTFGRSNLGFSANPAPSLLQTPGKSPMIDSTQP